MINQVCSLISVTTSNNSVFIKSNGTIERVSLLDIYAVTSEGNYCNILTSSNKFTLRSSLVKINQRFEGEGFIQVNKSTLIRIGAIVTVDLTNNTINLETASFSLSRNYRKDLINELNLL